MKSKKNLIRTEWNCISTVLIYCLTDILYKTDNQGIVLVLIVLAQID